MKLKLLSLAALVALSGCASAYTEDLGNGQHLISVTSRDISYPAHAKYSTDRGVSAAFLHKSLEACPDGHKRVSERYKPAVDGQEDAYEWIIECID